MESWKIVNAKDLILGRMCTQIAKRLILGERVVIINAQYAVLSGHRDNILKDYIASHNVRTHTNPTRGPFQAHRPDTFVRERLRCMLPKNMRGKDALKRVHVYINGIPKAKEESYKGAEQWQLKKCSADQLERRSVTVREICDHMGWSLIRRETPV